MRTTFMYAAGDVRIEHIPDPVIERPADAVVQVVRSSICGSELHRFRNRTADQPRTSTGHEFVGVVDDIGADVTTLRKGDFVIAPFAWSDGTCEFCRAGLHTSCLHGGFWNDGYGVPGGQAEAVRVPQADGTLVAVAGITGDSSLLASPLTLSDVYGTGWHAAARAGVTGGDTVVVIGDGAVGLLAVLSAKQLGADRIILMGRHKARTDLGRSFGASDVVAERGQDLQAALGFTPLEAGLAFPPMTLANFAVALVMPRLVARFGTAIPLIVGVALTLTGMVWLSRITPDGGYLTAVALPMVLIGAGQGFAFALMTSFGITVATTAGATATSDSRGLVVTAEASAALTVPSILLALAAIVVVALIAPATAGQRRGSQTRTGITKVSPQPRTGSFATRPRPHSESNRAEGRHT